MKLVHVSVAARDADGLSAFYKTVFGYEDRRPPTTLSGEKVSRGNGLSDSRIYSIWLTLPDVEGPFLEMLEYKDTVDRPLPRVNEPGFGHLSFEVKDIETTLEEIIRAGGEQFGEITDFGTANNPFLIVYVRDPEGNILELEQP